MKAIVLISAFVGGLISLVIEMAWIRSVFPVLGDLARAGVWVVALSLPGMAMGGVVISRRSELDAHPLRLLAVVHVGLAVGAGMGLAGMGPVRHVFTMTPGGLVWTGLQGLLLFLALLPSTFCMGGMLPALVRVAEGQGRGFGMVAGGIHFLGCAAGVVLGGILLPPLWGTGTTVVGAIGVAGAFFAAVMSLHSLTVVPVTGKAESVPPTSGGDGAELGAMRGNVCSWAAAGAGAASVLVLLAWVSATSQAFPSTVSSVAALLVGLGTGMVAFGAVGRRFVSPAGWLCIAWLLAGAALLVTPLWFSTARVASPIGRGTLVFPAAVAMGTVWPAAWQVTGGRSGVGFGRLWAFHVLGTLLGLTAALWVFPSILAAGRMFVWIGSACLVTGCGLAFVLRLQGSLRLSLLLVGFLALYGALLMPSREATAGRSPQGEPGTSATVDADRAQVQRRVPLVLHPKPQSVVYVGDVRAPGAPATFLNGEIEAMVVLDPCSGEVRRHLARHRGSVDVVLMDLASQVSGGAPSLFTRECYEWVLSSLRPGGLCFQWIPVYQLSRDEVLRMINTQRAVFGRVSLWRADLDIRRPVLGVAAWKDPAPILTAGYLEDRARTARARLTRPNRSLQLPYGLCFLYAGDMGPAAGEGQTEISTDDSLPFAFTCSFCGHGGDRFRGEAFLAFNDSLLAEGLNVPTSPFAMDPGLTSMVRMAMLAMRAGKDDDVTPSLPAVGDR